jgi:uncharacterized protein involved in exopolysaccharide biosynthesis
MGNDDTKIRSGEKVMEEPPPTRYEEDEINLREYYATLCRNGWKICGISLAVGVAMLLYMFTKPNIYQATAVITPSIDEKKQNPTLGALASFGVSIGGPSSVEDLESLFKSNDLSVRVFRKYNLWPIVLADKFDPATGKMKPCWTDRLSGGEKGPRTPGDWDAIRAAKDSMRVSVTKKSGTVSVSFESTSAEGSANIVKYFLDEGKSRLQEEALDRAIKNKKFIEEQIGKTVDALNRDRLYTLLGQEVEREMMARNREQFGFRVIDSPRIPDRKFRPSRVKSAVLASIAGFILAAGYFLKMGKTKG